MPCLLRVPSGAEYITYTPASPRRLVESGPDEVPLSPSVGKALVLHDDYEQMVDIWDITYLPK